jgi:hypothetical protein
MAGRKRRLVKSKDLANLRQNQRGKMELVLKVIPAGAEGSPSGGLPHRIMASNMKQESL